VSSEVELGIQGLSGAEPIGRGGFGTVYKALDEQLQRSVAVKVLDSLDAPIDRHRFDREGAALGRLSANPNIVTVYSAGVTNGGDQPYLVMEYVEGGSVRDKMQAEGKIAWREALNIAIPVGRALEAAHKSGILHRDIKPDNILLASDGPRLVDFGLATLSDVASLTSTGELAASWLHAPPETLANKRDERSDLYAFASTIQTMIQGRAPFQDDAPSLPALVNLIASTDPAPLPASLGPPKLIDALSAAMERDPDDRPATMRVFLDMLDEANDTPVAEVAGSEAHAATKRAYVAPVPREAPSTVPATRSRPNRTPYFVAAAALLVAVVGFLATRGGGDPSDEVSAGPETTASAPSSAAQKPSAPTTTVGSVTTASPSTTTAALTATELLTGTWEGTYTCGQGLIGLRLLLQGDAAGEIQGVFEGFAIPANPGRPDLAYFVNGGIVGDELWLRHTSWINQPATYLPSDLVAPLTDPAATDFIEGDMLLDQCTTFAVERKSSAPPDIPLGG